MIPFFLRIHRFCNRRLSGVFQRCQTTKVYSKPINAIFEMSSACNLRCPLCNTGGLKDHFKHVKRGSMSFETFKAGLDKLLPEVESVLLYNWGEPLLNKELFTCIDYARKHHVHTQMSSNMTLYSPEKGTALIDAGLSKLIVSCDGLTQKTYGKYRVGGDVSVVAANTLDMIRQKKERRSPTPWVEMQFIVFGHNEDEMEEYRQFWMNKGANSVNFIRMSYMSKIGQEIAQRDGFVPTTPGFEPHFPYGSLKRCSDPYNHVTINYNGDWYTCCFPSGETDYRVANIISDDFWTIWNGDYYQYCRRLIRTQKVSGAEVQTMCHDCTGVYPAGDGVRKYWSVSLPVIENCKSASDIEQIPHA